MTHDNRAALLTELIVSVIDRNSKQDDRHQRRARERAAKTLKEFKGTRVNHFAVQDRLSGLEERAEILHREDLAETLRQHVTKAESLQVQSMPDYLALLLELSDDPIKKTELSDLEDTKRTQETHVAELSWAEILRDDPLDNADGLWDSVDYAEESSIGGDDLSFFSGASDDTPESVTADSESANDGIHPEFEARPDPQDVKELEQLKSTNTEIRNHGPEVQIVSELQVVREVIFMLRGCKTDLFVTEDDSITPRANIGMQQLSNELLLGVLTQLSSLGSRLSRLRQRTSGHATDRIVQSFQSAVEIELHKFDSILSRLESQCVKPSLEPSTSLDILSEVQASCKNLLPLGDIYPAHSDQRHDLRVLELLYNLASTQQSTGNIDAYKSSVQMFETCFKTYLRPIQDWVLRGEIADDSSNLVKTSRQDAQSGYAIINAEVNRDSNDVPHAPYFLRSFVTKIFNAGKSLRLLQMLGKEPVDIVVDNYSLAILIDDSPEAQDLLPFSQLFDQSFGSWIQPIHLQITSVLSKTLTSQCGLQDAIGAMQELFLGQHGTAYTLIADSLLERLERPSAGPGNALTLAAIYHEAFTTSSLIEEDAIFVRLRGPPIPFTAQSKLGPFLETIEVSYKLPWIVSSIVQPDTLGTYRRIHANVLHLRVAKRAIDEKFHQNMIKYGSGPTQFSSLSLRLSHQLRWFTHTLQTYFLGIALQDAVPNLRRKLDEPGDIDAKVQAHAVFIRTAERRFLLHPHAARTQQAIVSMLELTLVAAKYLQSQWEMVYASKSDTAESQQESRSAASDVERQARLEGFGSTYTKFLSFVHAGVQDMARVEGDKCLQMLADTLAFGLAPAKSKD